MLKEMLGKVRLAFLQPRPSVVNRRSEHRPGCSLRATCRHQGQDLHGTILDLNFSGLRLFLSRPVEAGAHVLVSCRPGGLLVGRQRLRCRVAWIRQARSGGCVAGLQFADPENLEHSWVPTALRQLGFETPDSFKRRRTRRVEAQLAVRVDVERFGDFHRLGSATLLDVSTGGALLLLAEELNRGDVIRVQLESDPDVRLLGRVVKSSNGMQHVSFFQGEPRCDRQLERLVRRLMRRS